MDDAPVHCEPGRLLLLWMSGVNRVVAGVPFAGLQVEGIIVFLFLVPGIDHSLVVHIAVDHGRGGGEGGIADRRVRGVLFFAEGVQGSLVVDGGVSHRGLRRCYVLFILVKLINGFVAEQCFGLLVIVIDDSFKIYIISLEQILCMCVKSDIDISDRHIIIVSSF